MSDEIPTAPPVGPGATVAGVCGAITFALGFVYTSNLLWVGGALTLLLSFLYAHLRDKRQREYMADEYLRQQGQRDQSS